jgi:outer membrane protein assembly factor BamD (BamD/ComL family)
VYGSPSIQALVDEHFVPVRVHVRQKDEFARHRLEGFLPLEDFAGQLLLGHAHAARAREDFAAAAVAYAAVIERYPLTDAAAEAQYWAGVSRYKATGDAHALIETAREFDHRYQDSTWAKKASVWNQKEKAS